jgi:hypothetical protein
MGDYVTKLWSLYISFGGMIHLSTVGRWRSRTKGVRISALAAPVAQDSKGYVGELGNVI